MLLDQPAAATQGSKLLPLLYLVALPLCLWNLLNYVSWIEFPFTGLLIDGRPIGIDSLVFWTGARLALAGDPAAIYDPLVMFQAREFSATNITPGSPWLYPPTYLLLMLPLAKLPYLLAYMLLAVASFLGLLWVWRRAAPGAQGGFLLLASPAVYWNLLIGQNAFLTAALFGAGLLLLPRRPVWAGVAFGILTFKPQFGLLIPVALIASRQWRCIASAAATALLLLAASLIVLGFKPLTAFVETMLFYSQWAATNPVMLEVNNTFFAMSRIGGASISSAYAVQGLVTLLIALAVLRVWTLESSRSLRCAVLGIGAMLASPYLMYYDLVWSLLPLAWFAAHASEHGWRRGDRLWLLLVWLLPQFNRQFRELLGYQLAPLVLLGFFLWLLWRASEFDLQQTLRLEEFVNPSAGQ